MFVHFDPPRICLYHGGSICLVAPGSVLPEFSGRRIDLLVPRTALGATESHVTPALLMDQQLGALMFNSVVVNRPSDENN